MRYVGLRQWSSAVVFVAACLFGTNIVGAAPDPAQKAEQPSPQPNGDRLVRLLKKVADEGLLFEPDRMAKELNIGMTFKTQTAPRDGKSCEEGGSYKSFLLIEGEAGDSWFKSGPEGVPEMKVPPAFINPASVMGKPYVRFALYRTSSCQPPYRLNVEASLSFVNLSGFSCLRPSRLQALIGAEYFIATDGVSNSSYYPPATEEFGTDLRFTFRVGAPCALDATIRQDSQRSHLELRAFAKWRTCVNQATEAYCARNPQAKFENVQSHYGSVCGEVEDYIVREPAGGGPPPPLPDIYRYSGTPCER